MTFSKITNRGIKISKEKKAVPEKKILQVFDAVSKFQSLCATYGIDKAIFDKIQHVLDGLVTDDLDLLQLT